MVFPFLGELLKAIEPHLPICQFYRWQLDPNKWPSPTTFSLDPIIVTAILVGFPLEGPVPATCEIACNYPVPGAWTTEVLVQIWEIRICHCLMQLNVHTSMLLNSFCNNHLLVYVEYRKGLHKAIAVTVTGCVCAFFIS